MKYISLTELYSVAKTKPSSFLSEALKRGTVKDNCLELSEQNFEFLKNLSSGSSNKITATVQPAKPADSKPVVNTSNDVKVASEKENESYNFSNTKQARLNTDTNK